MIKYKNLIIIDLEENDVIGGTFEILENDEKEETIIKSSWNKGYSIRCINKDDLANELENIINLDIRGEKQ